MHLLKQILPCATIRSFGAFDPRSSPNSGQPSDLPSSLPSSAAPRVDLAVRYSSLLCRLRPTIRSTVNLQLITSLDRETMLPHQYADRFEYR